MVNLQRLGLIELREKYQFTPQNDSDPYQILLDHPTIKALSDEIGNDSGHRVDIWKGAVQQFCQACVYSV